MNMDNLRRRQVGVWATLATFMTVGVCGLASALDPALECEGLRAATIVVSPSVVISDQSSRTSIVAVLVTDDDGRPVCFTPVKFDCMDPGLICFPFKEAVTGVDGRALNYLQRGPVDPMRIDSAFVVSVGPIVSPRVPIRGSNVITEGTPMDFKAPQLQPFGSERVQLLRGTVATFIDGLPKGSRLGAGSIDPTIAEIGHGIVIGDPDPITGRQEIEFEIIAMRTGVTAFLIDTIDRSVYVAEIAGLFAEAFIRGDCDGDGAPGLADAVHLLMFLFQGGSRPGSLEACNVNDDSALGIADAVYLLTYLFQGGPAPPAPFPHAGADPTP